VLLALVTCTSGDGSVSTETRIAETSAGEELAEAAAATAPPFCLRLEPSRRQVLLGEPVLLIVGLENCSKQPLEVPSLLAAEYGFLTVLARPPGSEQDVVYYPAARREGRAAPYVKLAPGELLLEDVAIYFARDGWFLRAPGEYRFRARYATEQGEVESNETRIAVAPPTTSADRSAAQAMVSTGAGKTFYLGAGKAGAEGIGDLQRVAEQHGGTSWGAFARVALEQPAASGKGYTALLGAVSDPAVAAAAARRLAAAAGPEAVAGIESRLTGAAESALVRQWIEQTLRSK
jgi:hypothetical protein